MKKVFLLGATVLFAFACSNNAKTEEQEEKERDSAAHAQEKINQRYVDSLIEVDAAKSHDSMHMQDEGDHNHDHDHSHEGHTH